MREGASHEKHPRARESASPSLLVSCDQVTVPAHPKMCSCFILSPILTFLVPTDADDHA